MKYDLTEGLREEAKHNYSVIKGLHREIYDLEMQISNYRLVMYLLMGLSLITSKEHFAITAISFVTIDHLRRFYAWYQDWKKAD